MTLVIVANGFIAEPQEEFDRWVQEDAVLVAADGGTHYLLACGLVPQHVIGDLDSITSETREALEAQHTAFHTFSPYKNETDLELALLWAVAEYPVHDIVILGAMGGRPDQCHANTLLLALPQLRGKNIIIAEGQWCVRVISSGETCYVTGAVGDTLSLVPMGGPAGGVTTTGLLYPLAGETLHFGPARGVSNALTEPTATVSVERGVVWCFHEKQNTSY